MAPRVRWLLLSNTNRAISINYYFTLGGLEPSKCCRHTGSRTSERCKLTSITGTLDTQLDDSGEEGRTCCNVENLLRELEKDACAHL
jgi:hypothetical protein